MSEELPVIQLSSLPSTRLVCAGCGTYSPDGDPVSGKPVRHYALRTGHTSTFTVPWCDLCAKKVALFLIQETLQAKEEEGR